MKCGAKMYINPGYANKVVVNSNGAVSYGTTDLVIIDRDTLPIL